MLHRRIGAIVPLSSLIMFATADAGAGGNGGGGGNGGSGGNGGNGGGGGTGGNGGNGGGGQGGSQFVTVEQLNAAITGHGKRQEKAFQDMLNPLSESMKGVQEILAKLSGGNGGGGGTGGNGGNSGAGGNGGGGGTQTNPDLEKLRGEKAEMEKRLRAIEAEREAEKRKARDDRRNTAIVTSLGEAGITDGPRIKGALSALQASGAIDFGKEKPDELFWIDTSAGYRNELPLGDGIKSWLKTPEGAIYVPPTGAAGSGANPQGKNSGTNRGAAGAGNNAGPRMTRDQARNVLSQAFSAPDSVGE